MHRIDRIDGRARAKPGDGTARPASPSDSANPVHPPPASRVPVPCEIPSRPLRLCGEVASAPAFTMVELLVVLAVIAVLAALLFPALAGAREKGRQAVCASNLRQFALANAMYAQDNEGYFVPAAQG